MKYELSVIMVGFRLFYLENCIYPTVLTREMNYVVRHSLKIGGDMKLKTSIINLTLLGNIVVYHSDVIGASPVGAAPTNIFIFDLTPGLSGLSRDDYKTTR